MRLYKDSGSGGENVRGWSYGSGTGTWVKVSWVSCCRPHRTTLDSLRGTNKYQRVETVRCLDCGHRERRVWFHLPKAPSPDRVIPLPRVA